MWASAHAIGNSNGNYRDFSDPKIPKNKHTGKD
jgi:hypothetical protein